MRYELIVLLLLWLCMQPHFLAQITASSLLRTFKEQANRVKPSPQYEALEFIPLTLFRIKDSTTAGGFRYLSAEMFLKGEFIKWNGNNGYIGSGDEPAAATGHYKVSHIAQAFSHWTHHHTKRLDEHVLVCDIQGVGLQFTDATVCTKRGRKYGKADIGSQGWTNFFRTHKCNEICTSLNLPEEK
jgi:hypothetical protein